jgi:hypothetical protein
VNTQQAHIRVLLDAAVEEFQTTEALSLDTMVALQREGVMLNEVTDFIDERVS